MSRQEPEPEKKLNKMVKLVVTADDFGLSKGVDEGILVAFRQGIVRNTTLMVNYPDVQEAVLRLPDLSDLDVGIHLNLTSGPPVLKPKQVPSLVGADGHFLGLAGFLRRVVRGGIRWSEAHQEWQAQVERGLALGCRFSSITSHQHLHMLPPLARITVALARKYDIPFIRLSRFDRFGPFWTIPFKVLALNACAMTVVSMLRNDRAPHNDYLIGIPALPFQSALTRLCNRLTSLPDGLYELLCHPGHVDPTLQDRDDYTTGRLTDLAVITATEIREVCRRKEIVLTTFRNLAAIERADVSDQGGRFYREVEGGIDEAFERTGVDI